VHPSIDNYQQELSMEGQRRDIERFVDEHAYEIVRWYEDDGVSHRCHKQARWLPAIAPRRDQRPA
jgi:hypothetical protein